MSDVEKVDGHIEDPLQAVGPGVSPPPDPEVEPVVHRRRFSAAYKGRILAEADACEPGTLGALLRREGLYHSNLKRWRKERDDGMLDGLAPKKRGPTPDPDRDLKRRNMQLEKENKRLAKRLADAELIIDIQKKISMLLNQTTETEQKNS